MLIVLFPIFPIPLSKNVIKIKILSTSLIILQTDRQKTNNNKNITSLLEVINGQKGTDKYRFTPCFSGVPTASLASSMFTTTFSSCKTVYHPNKLLSCMPQLHSPASTISTSLQYQSLTDMYFVHGQCRYRYLGVRVSPWPIHATDFCGQFWQRYLVAFILAQFIHEDPDREEVGREQTQLRFPYFSTVA